MKKLTAFICLFCAFSVSALAQRIARDPSFPEWDTPAYSHPVPPEYADQPAYYVLNSVNMDYKFEGRHTTLYSTLHRIVKVQDEKGIESFNTISIPVYPNSKILSIKARTILRNGKAHNIADSMIKVTRNESGVFEVVIALEGVEKNSEIEYLLKEIQQAPFTGWRIFQFEIPVQHTFFTMTYPKELRFEEKSYNGFPDMKDTLLKSKRRQMSVYKADIPALKDEPFCFYDLYRMRAEYKFSYYPEEDEQIRQLSWDELAQEMHNDVYKLTDKEKTAVNKYISTLGVTNHGTDLENIKKIEDGIKNNIVLYHYIDEENATNLDSIIMKKEATHSGYLKLFAACFTMAGVPHELGVTTDRHEHPFDSKFENWSIMDDYVFYFPTLKKFLAPLSVYFRYPMVPDDMINNKGVFCAVPPVGKLTGPISEIKTIPALPANESQKNITAEINFSTEMEPEVNITYSYSGYTAMSLRTMVMLLSGEKREDAVKRLITIADKPEDIIKYTTANEAFGNYYTNKPLEISATVKTPGLVEMADKKYLFKIGDVIGDQPQLYKKKERKLPVDIDYPYTQNRTITVNIPKGYKVLNPETIRKQADYVDANGKPIMAFASDYTIVKDAKHGDKLTVTINQFYTRVHYSTDEYERFRNVVNTAADFNNATLVLAKK